MPSQRQIAANRRNALRSTGPRTPQGKYIAARNHTLHGFSSPDPLLPDEDPAEFAASLAKWRNCCQPAGPHQEELVYRFAVAVWRLQRIPRLEDALFAAAAKALSGPPGPLPKWGRDPLEKLIRLRITAQCAYSRALRALPPQPARRPEMSPSKPIPIMGRSHLLPHQSPILWKSNQAKPRTNPQANPPRAPEANS
jgi:hypothetical protein